MNTDDTPTPISVDDRFDGLPTGNRPRTHRGAKKPTGLNWDQINADYEANQGVRKDTIWAQGNVVIASRGGIHEQSFVEHTDYQEPAIPPRPPAEEIVVPEDLDQVDSEELLTGETYEGLVETPKPPTTQRYDYDIWTKDAEAEPTPESADASATPPRKGGRQRAFTPDQTAEIVNRYQSGESTTSLAQAFDSNHATIWRTLDREGVEMRRQGPPTGTRKPAFTREQETDVVRRYRLGESMESIAASFNTYATTVRRALVRNNVTLRGRGAPRQTEETGLKLREGDQPLPIKNDAPDIQSMVIADIENRRQVGIQRYGTALQPHNGRDMLLDAYEEAMDLCIYLKGVLVERDSSRQAV